MKTFFKWQGNKSKHFKYIIPEIPTDFKKYIEPFVGSGAVFLKIQPKRWIINDLNENNISIWKLAKENPKFIEQKFKSFQSHFPTKTNPEKLKYCREQTASLNSMKKTNEYTVLYLLMTYCAYLGVILFGKCFYFRNLEMNIYVKNKHFFLNPSYFDNLKNVSTFLNKTKGTIMNEDYKKILQKAKEGDFVFMDPPYKEEHDYGFKYNKDENVNRQFLDDLKEQCDSLDRKNVKWIMTQADTKSVRETFHHYIIKKYPVYRRGSKCYKNELLIKNF
jgi:DNA adenine methylase